MWTYTDIPSLKLTARTWKWMVGRLVSFKEGLFSGAMLVSGRVCIQLVTYIHVASSGVSFIFSREIPGSKPLALPLAHSQLVTWSQERSKEKTSEPSSSRSHVTHEVDVYLRDLFKSGFLWPPFRGLKDWKKLEVPIIFQFLLSASYNITSFKSPSYMIFPMIFLVQEWVV